MNYKPVIPQDNTFIPGMKTIMADATSTNEVNYTKDIVYVQRPEEDLVLQLLSRAEPDWQTGNIPEKLRLSFMFRVLLGWSRRFTEEFRCSPIS